jgi:hypothetical protein
LPLAEVGHQSRPDSNINNSFDLATALAGAKDLAEVVELQAAYWRKQLGYLSARTKDVRALSRDQNPR